METLNIWLFGSPRIEVGGHLVEINRHKAVALLAYLALTGLEQPRDTLAALFWPESPQNRARASLRRDLSVLKSSLQGDWLAVNQETIELKRPGVSLDVDTFRRKLISCKKHGHPESAVCHSCLQPLAEAAAIYRDDFLKGFSLTDCPEFDDWQFFEADQLRLDLASALSRLVKGYSTQGDYDSALPIARRWLSLDSLHEPAHRVLMQLYAMTGQKAAALRQYQVCAQTLEEELGISPSDETNVLYEQIRSSEAMQDAGEKDRSVPAGSVSWAGRQHHLPVPATSFVGRVEGLVEIAQRLSDPICRMLTLVGPGGIGKTRLAIQTARNLVSNPFTQSHFAQGVYYVRLVSASSTSHLIHAIAHALSYSFNQEVGPKEQLLSFLAEKEMLLVLDNFEHLLNPNPNRQTGEGETGHKQHSEASEPVEIVGEILARAPKVKILVTSREALKLQQEWVYPVEGLRYPAVPDGGADDIPENFEKFSAAQLFLQTALRVRPEFSLEKERDCVIKICRLVEGMPLAIELAAAWLKVLPCEEIIRQVDESLDFLATSLRDVSDRHRSMRAIFEHSWQLLSGPEKVVLRRLSIFRGGFQYEAARYVARASLPELTSLIEKSLVQTTMDGRYRLHGLLRQFSAEKLEESPADYEETWKHYIAYYISYLKNRTETLKSNQQKTALEEIRLDLANVRASWEGAVREGNIGAVEKAMDSLYEFYWISSRFQEGADAFQRAVAELQSSGASEHVLVRLNVLHGAFSASLGRYELARDLLMQSLSKARQIDSQREIAFSLDLLGNVVDVQGDSQKAAQFYRESLALGRAGGDPIGTAKSLYNLGWIAVGKGAYPEALSYIEESLALYRVNENQVGIAHALYSHGMIAFVLGDYPGASRYFQDSLMIFDGLGDPLGIARVLGGLGLVAWAMGPARYLEARQYSEESLSISRAVGHRLQVARRLAFLGSIENSLGEYAKASEYLQEALLISREIGFTFGIPWSLGGLGEAALGQGNKNAAKDFFLQAIDIAMKSQDLPVVTSALVSLADLWLQEKAEDDKNDLLQNSKRPAEILEAVLSHPATWQIFKDRAAALLSASMLKRGETDRRGEAARGSLKSLEELVFEILSRTD